MAEAAASRAGRRREADKTREVVIPAPFRSE
jgi:hypothetical protein